LNTKRNTKPSHKNAGISHTTRKNNHVLYLMNGINGSMLNTLQRPLHLLITPWKPAS
jgi:hypothetical protein